MHGHIYRHICSAQHRAATHTNAPPCYCLCCLYALTEDTTRQRYTHCQVCHIGHAYQRHARKANAQHIRRQHPPPSTGQALHFSSCVLSCLLSCLHTTNAATLARFTLGRIATNAHTIRQHLQPTPPTVQPHNASRCTWHIPPTIQRRKACRNHCR